MINNHFLLSEVKIACQGDLIQKGLEEFVGISTDSRENMKGALFIPLRGENFDAHDFLDQAIASGCAAVLVDKEVVIEDKQITILKVKDTLKALQDLGLFWRKKFSIPVIALTGTNGKTTTKEFLRQILSSKYLVCASEGSLNNHWGVPMSLLHINQDHKVMISEMGMNHPGEIANLCKIAEPSITMVTNVGRGHLEGMHSLENIAKEKQEIYLHSPHSQFVFNIDNVYTLKMYQKLKTNTSICFSTKDKKADLFFQAKYKDEKLFITGHIGGYEGSAAVNIFGEHNLENLLAASSCAYAFGMSAEEIWQALPRCQTIWGRNQWVQLKGRSKVLFDAYNANPESMDVFLKNAEKTAIDGRKFLVIGDMRELGSYNDSEHTQLANRVSQQNWEKVYFIGNNSKLFAANYKEKNLVISYTYKEDLAFSLLSMLEPGDTVFMKASRGVHLEKFLNDLEPQDFKNK